MRPAVSSEQNEASTAGGERETLVGEKERLKERQHELNSSIGRAKKEGRDPAQLIEENRDVSRRIKEIAGALAEEEEDRSGRAEDTLTTDVLTTTEAFRDLRSEWTDLMSRANVYSPFMMWEWLYPWWEYYGQNKQLRLITVRDAQGRLVGLAPMMLGFTENGKCDRRILAFVGSGEEGPRGQYFTFVVEPELQEPVLGAMVSCLWEMSSDWQLIRLWRVRKDEAYRHVLCPLTDSEGMAVILERHGVAVHGPLPSSMTDFIDAVPNANKRSYLRHQEKKLNARYATVRHEVCENSEDLPYFLRTIHELNTRRHRAKGGDSAWLAPGMRSCFHETARFLFEVNALRAHLLYLDRQPVAGRIALLQNGTCFVFESGLAPDFARDRVGVVLLARFIEDCIDIGVTHFDWLSSHDYMYQYFCSEHTLLDLTVFEKAGGNLARVGSRLWLRGMKDSFKRTIRWPALRRFFGGAG